MKINYKRLIYVVLLSLIILSLIIIMVEIYNVRTVMLNTLTWRLDKGAIHLDKGNVYLSRNDYSSAEQEFIMALKYRPEWDIAVHNMHVARAGEGRETLHSNDIAYANSVAASNISDGKLFDQFSKHLPMPSEIAFKSFSEAIKALEAGDFETALIQYDRAIKEYPRYCDAYGNAGSLLLSLNRPAEARQYLMQYLELIEQQEQSNILVKRRIGRGLFLLGRACLEMGDEECLADVLKKLDRMKLTSYIDALKHNNGYNSQSDSVSEKSLRKPPESGGRKR